MLAQVLHGLGETVFWIGFTLIVIQIFGWIELKVNTRKFTLRLWYTYVILSVSGALQFFGDLADGDVTAAVIDGLAAVGWGYFAWWIRKRGGGDDDDKRRRRQKLKTLGEKSKAKLKKMADRVKPGPIRRPAPMPV